MSASARKVNEVVYAEDYVIPFDEFVRKENKVVDADEALSPTTLKDMPKINKIHKKYIELLKKKFIEKYELDRTPNEKNILEFIKIDAFFEVDSPAYLAMYEYLNDYRNNRSKKSIDSGDNRGKKAVEMARDFVSAAAGIIAIGVFKSRQSAEKFADVNDDGKIHVLPDGRCLVVASGNCRKICFKMVSEANPEEKFKVTLFDGEIPGLFMEIYSKEKKVTPHRAKENLGNPNYTNGALMQKIREQMGKSSKEYNLDRLSIPGGFIRALMPLPLKRKSTKLLMIDDVMRSSSALRLMSGGGKLSKHFYEHAKTVLEGCHDISINGINNLMTEFYKFEFDQKIDLSKEDYDRVIKALKRHSEIDGAYKKRRAKELGSKDVRDVWTGQHFMFYCLLDALFGCNRLESMDTDEIVSNMCKTAKSIEDKDSKYAMNNMAHMGKVCDGEAMYCTYDYAIFYGK